MPSPKLDYTIHPDRLGRARGSVRRVQCRRVQEGILAEHQLQRLPVRHDGGTLERVVPLDGEIAPIDIDAEVKGLPEEEAVAIRKRFAEGRVDLSLRKEAVDVDGRMLRSKLGHAVQAAVAADEHGLSVTETPPTITARGGPS